MSTEIAVRGAAAVIQKPEFKVEVANALIGESIGAAKFLRVTRTAILKNPDLESADPASVVTAALQCAGFGLLLDGREAAFVTFYDKKKQRNVAQFMPMVAGLRKKAAEHGVQIAAYCVYENDRFEHELGLHPRIEHVPVRLGQERGQMIGCYAVATDRDGLKYVDVMAKAEVDAIRARSRTSDRGPWVTDYDEMAKKTVVRRVFKQIPLLQLREPGLFVEEPGFELSGGGPLHDLPTVNVLDEYEVVVGEVVDEELAGEEGADSDADAQAGVPGSEQAHAPEPSSADSFTEQARARGLIVDGQGTLT